MSVKVSVAEKGVLVREAFELSMSSGSVVSVSEVVRRRLFPVSVGHLVVEPRPVVAVVEGLEERAGLAESVAVAVEEKLAERPKVKGHVHRVKANGPVPVCECGAVRDSQGVWG